MNPQLLLKVIIVLFLFKLNNYETYFELFNFSVSDDFSNEMYYTICKLSEKQLDNLSESDREYRSILINLKLTNSLFYKIMPIVTKKTTNWLHSYLLTNIISRMLSFVDSCNKVCS